jgi:hypothetical protein
MNAAKRTDRRERFLKMVARITGSQDGAAGEIDSESEVELNR